MKTEVLVRRSVIVARVGFALLLGYLSIYVLAHIPGKYWGDAVFSAFVLWVAWKVMGGLGVRDW